MLKTLVEVLSVAQKNKYAVIAPDFFSLDFAKILLECGEKYQAPLILSYFENNKETFELKELGKCIRIVREESARASIPVVLHLDHADNLKIIRQCLDFGFTSVMIDASTLPFDKNVEITCKAVELARIYKASVEAELGHVGIGGNYLQIDSNRSVLTDPDQARIFTAQTGIDALAISIGTQHGFYEHFDGLYFDLLEKISAEIPIPLVLHGASGTDHEQLKKAVALGICKMNVFTELVTIYQQVSGMVDSQGMEGVQKIGDYRKIAVDEKLHTFLEISGSIGKAKDFPVLPISQRAIQLFQSSYTCSEAIFMAFAEREGFTDDISQRLLAMFTGGICNSGGLCGAITGGLAVLAARRLPVNPNLINERQDVLMQGRELVDSIKQRFGYSDCLVLSGINFLDAEQAAQYLPKQIGQKVCIPVIKAVCGFLDLKK